MSTTSIVPAAYTAAGTRQSSMGYADLYGAGDDTGPNAGVAGSLGYQSTLDANGDPAPVAAAAAPAGLDSLTQLGHNLIDSHAGLLFLAAGALLLVLWHDATK